MKVNHVIIPGLPRTGREIGGTSPQILLYVVWEIWMHKEDASQIVLTRNLLG